MTEALGRRPNAAEVAAAEGVDEATLRRELRAGRAARRVLVEANTRLVYSIATKEARKQRMSVSIEDLAQDGTMGLLKAVASWDPERGTRFSTYAWHAIRSSILVGLLDDTSSPLRLSSYMLRKIRELRRAWATLEAQQASPPSNEALAHVMGVPVERVEALERLRRMSRSAATSLDAPRTSHPAAGTATTLMARVVAPSAQPDEVVLARHGKSTARHSLSRALASLSPRQRQVLARRYELEHYYEEGEEEEEAQKRFREISPTGADGKPSHRQVGEDLGISAVHARTLEVQALRKLRQDQLLADELRNVYEDLVDGYRARGNEWGV